MKGVIVRHSLHLRRCTAVKVHSRRPANARSLVLFRMDGRDGRTWYYGGDTAWRGRRLSRGVVLEYEWSDITSRRPILRAGTRLGRHSGGS